MKSETLALGRWSFISLVFVLSLILILPVFLYGNTMQKAVKVGDETCAECHDEVAADFAKNIHASYAESKGFLCESCHGAGSLHAEEGDATLIYNPATDYNPTGKNTCLDCHNGSNFESVTGKAHYELANGCSDCHQVHSIKKNLLKKTGSELCIDCHQDIRAKFLLTSHHPVREGLMECQDCHEVHGGTTKHAFAGGSRELCVSCHPAKEGPFVYEHQPVNEDCGICHDPHGAVADNLLTQSEPALCLSCHPMHFHTSLTGFNGAFTTPLHPERGGKSTLDGFKVSMLTKCTQCHTQIHGSDMSSQSISGQGKALTR